MIAPSLGLPLALYALQAAIGGGSSSTLFSYGIQLAAIIAIAYFVMIRPQQKQRQQHESALKALKRGDEVVTAGGLVGQVIHIADSRSADANAKGLEDRVTIRSGESRLVVERGRIAKIMGTANAGAASTSASASAE